MFSDYLEPPERPVDKSVTLVCDTEGCTEYGEEWHPEVYSEWQGTREAGGPVDHYALDAFDCAECGLPGKEVR
jgi:hypothetical protein